MEEMIGKMVETIGIDKDITKKVAESIAEHADEVPGWLASAGRGECRLPASLGGLLG